MTDYAARNAYLDEFQISERYDDYHPDPTTRLVMRLVDDIVCADEDMIRLGGEITELIERANAKVAARQNVARLGELQRTPVEYDQACSARQIAIENLRHIVTAFRETRTA